MPKYPLTEAQMQQLLHQFTYHAPKDDQPSRYVAMRDKGRELAQMFMEETPASGEQEMALFLLRLAIMCANQAIALNE